MNITISDPTPLQPLPPIYQLLYLGSSGWTLGYTSLDKSWVEEVAKRNPGSRLIKIDPNAPSFEPGPTEWVGSDKTKYSFDPTRPEWIDMMFDGEAPTTICPNTRTDIGRVISALVTKWHAAKEGT